jgi:hypothetical protein
VRVVPAVIVLITLACFPASFAEEVGDGLTITFDPETLELAFREEGVINIAVSNDNNHTMYVRIVHFQTKSPEGSSTWIDPDILVIEPGRTNISRLTIRSNFQGREASSTASDVLLAFNWSLVSEAEFMNEDDFVPKWQYTYDVIDGGSGWSRSLLSVTAVIIVVAIGVVFYISLTVMRRPNGPPPPGEKN